MRFHLCLWVPPDNSSITSARPMVVIAFIFVSDELNGVTLDNKGNVRPLKPCSFSSLSQAEEENGQSRIYLGRTWFRVVIVPWRPDSAYP
ncbi:MAG: hypothetical protein ACT4OO_13215 [Nitrospiraceae bacterium]